MSTTSSIRPSSSSSTISTLVASPTARTTSLTTLSTSALATTPSPSAQQRPAPPSQFSTPQNKQSPLPTLAPGPWRHPREDEIMQRLNMTNFDKTNVYTIIRSAIVLVASFGVQSAFYALTPTSSLQQIGSIPSYVFLAVRLLFLLNIGLALRPLLRKPDACEDIPLTPSQRHLFGLPPLARPATPQEQEQYITPPRYARSASGTPRSSSSSLYAEVSGSPLNLSDRRTSFNGSTPFRSPSGSPLGGLQPHRGGSGERRKLSYTANRNSPLSISEFDAAGSVSTPTKTAGNRASVGLNSKWLYEKGKANGSAWATGSVFS